MGSITALPDGRYRAFASLGTRPNAKVQPRPGDRVYVHLQAEDVEVLKVYRPDRGHTLLTSYNQMAKPIIVDENNPGVVQGIYLGLEAKGPRAR